MTTIAYHHKSKTIAWDSRATEGGIIKNDSSVKVRERNGVRFWLTGCRTDYEMLIDAWFGSELSIIPEAQALVLDGDKVYGCSVNDDRIFWREELEANESIGSGRYWALAAMDFGKSAKEAVEYAKTRDCYTGGDVQTVELLPKQEKKPYFIARAEDLNNPANWIGGIIGGEYVDPNLIHGYAGPIAAKQAENKK